LLGWVNYDQGDFDKAISLYEQGIKIAEERLLNFLINDYDEPVHAYNNRYYLKLDKQTINGYLYNIYTELGDYKKAHEYYVLSKQAEEEIFLETNQNLITMLESISENEKTKKTIALLASDNELKEMKINQSRMINFGIAGIFIIFILIGVLFLRQKKMQVERNTVVLEQKLLRLQMNPHFIFNALSNILILVDKKNTTSASMYLTTFAKLLRTTLECSRQENIFLEEEVSALKSYLELQKLSFENKFEYTVYVDDNIDPEAMAIPPMLIQPFIENAIQHGIRLKQDKGHIFVRFMLENNKVICEVEDDGVGREKAWEAKYQKRKTHKSLATTIINERIRTINKKMKQKIRLDIIDLKSEKNEPKGTKIVLNLPLS